MRNRNKKYIYKNSRVLREGRARGRNGRKAGGKLNGYELRRKNKNGGKQKKK